MEDTIMTKVEKYNYISSIESTISIICEHQSSYIVTFVFQKYGAHDLYDISPSDLPYVFIELEFIANDCC